jgi:glycerol uptake facilitator-like aquaporin
MSQSESTTGTKYLIPFTTGDVKVILGQTSVNNKEKALLAAHILRNIAYALETIVRINMCGISCQYEINPEVAAKLALIGNFEASGKVNDWQLELTNGNSKHTLNYKKSDDQATIMTHDLFSVN